MSEELKPRYKKGQKVYFYYDEKVLISYGVIERVEIPPPTPLIYQIWDFHNEDRYLIREHFISEDICILRSIVQQHLIDKIDRQIVNIISLRKLADE